MVKKAVIPIGGLGSRFLPATKAMAKETFPVVDKPILMLLLEECIHSGITEVFIVLSPNKMFVKKFFEDDPSLEERLKKANRLNYLDSLKFIKNNLKITFGVQQNAKGSGDAIFPAEKWVKNQPFAVLFGDDINYTANGQKPAIGQCIEAYEKTGKLVIGCKRFKMTEIPKYSSCILGKRIASGIYETSGIVEKPLAETAPSNCAGLARYVLPAKIFDVLRRTPLAQNGELGLTEAMDIVAREDGATVCVFRSRRYDTGDRVGYFKAVVEYSLRHPEIGPEVKKYLKDLVKTGFSQAYNTKK